jgi:uncharacterized integral membrane protein
VERSRETLQDDVLSLLSASRELSPDEDPALADAFVRHLQVHSPRERQRGASSRWLFAWATALVILLAIPVVMVIETYSSRDGYLPPLDAGALPLVYWIALVAVVLCLVATLIGERRGWQLRVSLTRESPS